MKLKKLIAMFVSVSCIVSLAGCKSETATVNPADSVKTALSDVSSAVKADGREYGNTYELSQNDTMESAFFNCKINSAEILEEIDEYVPNDETYRFLKLNITVTNTFQDSADIVMFYNDFELTWDELDGSTIFAETAFAQGQLPDEYSLFKNKERTGDLIFTIPEDAQNIKFIYQEYWDDDFEGNRYIMAVDNITK